MSTREKAEEFLRETIINIWTMEHKKFDNDDLESMVQSMLKQAEKDKKDLGAARPDASGKCQTGLGVENCGDSKINLENWLKEALKDAQDRNPGKLPGDVGF